MNLRQKLLLLVSLTVAAAVAVVAWAVLVRIRSVFEQRDQQDTALFVSQFERDFQHSSNELLQTVDHLAASERARNMAFELGQNGDTSPFLNEAQVTAQEARLDFLEIIGADGSIVSSAQWPARFGYPEPAAATAHSGTFLKREELADGNSALGIFALRTVGSGNSSVRLLGGMRLDQNFLADLPAAPGMTIGLYAPSTVTGGLETAAASNSAVFDPARLITANGKVPGAERYQGLIEAVQRAGTQQTAVIYPSGRRDESLNVAAIPLKSDSGQVLAVLTVALSRSAMVAAQQHIRAIAYSVAGMGILLGIAFSLWITARVTQPVEQLARAAEQVAAGDWDAEVPERGRDEIGQLARSFNHMTDELKSQRERLVQSERVAAWRELARRLAHELKNPLFPLQLTVENLVRSRALSADEFDEVFRESTTTLEMEIANLKKIIGRFSDFSKMPKPELERIDASAVVERVRKLYETAAKHQAKVQLITEVSSEAMPMLADPELLHRAISNLVLNAMDAMPSGGTVTISARPNGAHVELRVADTGEGLTPEECERLFTPYYTTKQHGTGLGLAIVQSVIADHAGTIAVESRAGAGATFIITLRKAEA